jgi:hypothetical protein
VDTEGGGQFFSPFAVRLKKTLSKEDTLPCVFILAHGKVFSPPKSQIQLLLKIFFST